MFITDEVLKFDKLRLFIDRHPLNILAILVTFDVSKLDKFSNSNDLQR